MKCSDFERLVALYVEEDLHEAERASVEAHLRTCSTCWDLAEDLKESQSVLKSIRQHVPAAAALSNLRERVMSEVEGLQSASWFERLFPGAFRRRAALAGVLVLVAGYGVWQFARVPAAGPASVPQVPVQTAASRPPAPVVVAPPVVSETKAPAPRRIRRKAPALVPLPASEQAPQQVTIKLLTDDPNVIIYWLVDEKGD